MESFKVEPYDRYDKSITVTGPEGLILSVDYDDVDRDVVDELLKTLLQVLNRPSREVWHDAADIGQARSDAKWEAEVARMRAEDDE